MNKLEQVIYELCANRVVFKSLGEIATITRGGSFQKKDYCETGVPCIHYGQIYTQYSLFAKRTFSYIGTEVANKQKMANPNDIIMAVTSENIEDVCKCVAWLGKDKIAVSGHTAIIHHSQNPKYLTYFFHSNMFLQQKKKIAHGTKVIEVTPDKLKNIKIPVPPLPVQAEVVRILDNFTQLTAELTAELTARKKQYEYYRDELLNFNDNTSTVMLGDVGDVTKLAGFEFTSHVKYRDEGEIIALRGLNVKEGKLDLSSVKYIDGSNFEKLNRSKLQKGDMLLTYVGTIGQVAVIDEDDRFYLAPNVARIRFDTKVINPEFMRFYFQTSHFFNKQINKFLNSSSMKNLTMENIRKFSVPIPSMKEQNRLVKLLQHFDKLCNDISEGLPAEIAARQKQYEYYRDKLLTFKELKQED